MLRKNLLVLAVIAGLFCSSPSHALCSYKGKMYAKTTVSEEFKDSRWVVKVRVMAADSHWSDEDESWTLYRVLVLETFKGQPPPRVSVFTFRDSGGFFLDKGMSEDLGGEYLLFLDPVVMSEGFPEQARGASEVNYACGQSKGWGEVSGSELRELKELALGK